MYSDLVLETDLHGVADETAVELTRRALLGAGGGAVLTLFGGGTASALAATRRASGSRVWRRSSYHPLVGHAFSVRGSHARLRLASVENLPARPAGSENAFALTFKTSSPVTLPHGLPTLHHPALGRFQLFLVPAAASGASAGFFAVIDRTHG